MNISVHRETASLLRHYAGGKKIGAMIDRLVHEYHGRQEGRAAAVAQGAGGDDAEAQT